MKSVATFSQPPAEVLKLRHLRWLGFLALNTALAIFATPIFEGALYRAIPVHTISAILWKEWCLDITCATLIGFLMYRTWKSSSTKWVWVIPTLWFGFGVLVNGGLRHTDTVLYQDSAFRHFLTQFSGTDCKNGSRSPGCLNFFLFSVPFVRAVFYSIGGAVSSHIYFAPQKSVEASGFSDQGGTDGA
jgi:hypothetical protein